MADLPYDENTCPDPVQILPPLMESIRGKITEATQGAYDYTDSKHAEVNTRVDSLEATLTGITDQELLDKINALVAALSPLDADEDGIYQDVITKLTEQAAALQTLTAANVAAQATADKAVADAAAAQATADKGVADAAAAKAQADKGVFDASAAQETANTGVSAAAAAQASADANAKGLASANEDIATAQKTADDAVAAASAAQTTADAATVDAYDNGVKIGEHADRMDGMQTRIDELADPELARKIANEQVCENNKRWATALTSALAVMAGDIEIDQLKGDDDTNANSAIV